VPESTAAYSIDSRITRFAPPEPIVSSDAAAALARPIEIQTETAMRTRSRAESRLAESRLAEAALAQSALAQSALAPSALAESALAESALTPQSLRAAPTRPEPARTGVRGLLSSVGIRVGPSAAEQAQRDSDARLARDETVIRQATWTRAVSVLVANRKGGVGKTPVSLLLGGTLASVRGGSVCVLEVSDDPGALGYRAEGSPANGLGELLGALGRVSTAGQLAGYTAPQTSFASVIGSVGDRRALTRDDVLQLCGLIDAFYGIRVMDSGNQTSSPVFAGALDTADALVIPVLNSGDAVFDALSLLERLRRMGGRPAHLADNAIIMRLTDGRPVHPQVMERVDRVIARAGVAGVFSVPFDAHIAERGELTLGSLDPATYRVFAAAAATIVSSLRIPTN